MRSSVCTDLSWGCYPPLTIVQRHQLSFSALHVSSFSLPQGLCTCCYVCPSHNIHSCSFFVCEHLHSAHFLSSARISLSCLGFPLPPHTPVLASYIQLFTVMFDNALFICSLAYLLPAQLAYSLFQLMRWHNRSPKAGRQKNHVLGSHNRAGKEVKWCFFDDPADVGNLISGSSAFSKTSLNIWKFLVHILLKAWRILSITLLAYEMSAIVQ